MMLLLLFHVGMWFSLHIICGVVCLSGLTFVCPQGIFPVVLECQGGKLQACCSILFGHQWPPPWWPVQCFAYNWLWTEKLLSSSEVVSGCYSRFLFDVIQHSVWFWLLWRVAHQQLLTLDIFWDLFFRNCLWIAHWNCLNVCYKSR